MVELCLGRKVAVEQLQRQGINEFQSLIQNKKIFLPFRGYCGSSLLEPVTFKSVKKFWV